ncbi:MAG: glucosidase [Thermosynechococcaceae cyanobacterium]
MSGNTAEEKRLAEARTQRIPWKKWGPYLSDRQWGTVREDYSPYGSAWDFFPHDQARSRAYRWGEDGLLGISDDRQLLCFAIALWNGEDPILKERLFGLTGNEGNHGEDVKEYYFYLDSTPTHSYLKALYKYPHHAYPYDQIVAENKGRSRQDPEFELLDTGVFDENRYFDVFVEYAKQSPEDILIQITVANRGAEAKTLHLLPTLWFRNTWAWANNPNKPSLKLDPSSATDLVIEATHPELGQHWLYGQGEIGGNRPPVLFTENETNRTRLNGAANATPFVKDGINNAVVHGQGEAVNPDSVGTKCAMDYVLTLGPNETQTIRLRLSNAPNLVQPLGSDFDTIWQTRLQEANEFYQQLTPFPLSDDLRNIQRQAFAGMLWSKQYYAYSVEDWLAGDPAEPTPPPERQRGRNAQWVHFDAADILSMPDKWEYPWFAAWDLAFHTLPLALLDPDFAKAQLDVITREWFMHPNGQLPAYEWAFGDVNPPVHAWATWRVYKIEQKRTGTGDRMFLERVFQKLLLNFTWWVNRKDIGGNNVFEGGFLGLDNIGVFDRSAPLPTGGYLEQSDGTSWMAMYALNMLTIALELAIENPVYEDIATKFFEHFVYIAAAMDRIGMSNDELWDDADGFFYDVLELPSGESIRLKVRSMVGLIPLFAVTTIEPEQLNRLPAFKARLEWFLRHRPNLVQNLACMETPGVGARRLLAICSPKSASDKLRRILQKMLDESEFFSPHGIRALSKVHDQNPYRFEVNGVPFQVDYEPAESSSGLFGGNSNWRGPVWFPVNFLLIESLQQFHYYLGDDFKVECPTGSGCLMNLWEVATELSQRLIRIFPQDATGHRPVYGATATFQQDPHWQDLILFYEYFHGDNGAGIGASHQTGWTGLVAKLIQQLGEYKTLPPNPS